MLISGLMAMGVVPTYRHRINYNPYSVLYWLGIRAMTGHTCTGW